MKDESRYFPLFDFVPAVFSLSDSSKSRVMTLEKNQRARRDSEEWTV